MVKIVDVTARDGIQGANFYVPLSVRKKFVEMSFDSGIMAVEAGMPESSIENFNNVKHAVDVANSFDEAKQVVALSRLTKSSIERTLDALNGVKNGVLHLFISSSDKQNQVKFEGKSQDDIQKMVHDVIRNTRDYIGSNRLPIKIQFSPEDASNTTDKMLYRYCMRAIDGGVDILNIPDTNGVFDNPIQYAMMMDRLRENLRNSYGFNSKLDDIVFSVHGHNDKGIVNDSFNEVIKSGGVERLESTILGVGEGAGMASIERLVSENLETFSYIDINALENYKKFVNGYFESKFDEMGIPNDPFPFSPNGVFAKYDGSGIHCDGSIKGRQKGVNGVYRGSGFVTKDSLIKPNITDFSGASNIYMALGFMGYDLNKVSDEDATRLLTEAKRLCSVREREVSPEEISKMYIRKNVA